jgi:hypothetical protein
MKYIASNGNILDTEKAKAQYPEQRDSNGSNLIGRSSRDQWSCHTVYLSSKGNY